MSVTATRNLLVRAGFDATGMRSGVRQGNRYLNQFGTNANNTMNSLNNIIGSTMSRIGKLIAGAFAIGAIVNFGKECLELGSNLSEVQNVVDVTFGSMANEVNEFAKNALTSFGLSETSAKKYTSTMGAMLKSSGFATDKALEMSKAITALSADMASFYNLDTDEAFEKIRSGISGETEPLKQLGINMSVANLEAYALSQGITKSWSSMTQAEQTLLRYNYLLSVTADAQGDFARTSDSWANQTRILSEQFNALKAEIGQGLIAAFTPIVKVLNLVVNKLRVAAGYFRAFMELIFGKQSSSGGSGMAEVAESTGGIADSANGASDAVGGIGDAASGAGKKAKKAAKEAKGALASFDELNQLNISKDSDSGSGSGGSGGGGGSGLENMGGAVEVDLGKPIEETDHLSTMFDGLLAQLARMKDLFAEGFQIGLGGDFDSKIADIKESIEGIKTSLKDIFTDSEVVASAARLADAIALNLGKITGSIASIGVTIAQNLLGGLDKYLAQNSQYIKDRLIGIMNASADIANLAGDFAVAFADIFSVFGGETGQQCTANIIGIFENAFLGSAELATKFGRDILELITQPIIENKDKIKLALENTLKVFESLSGTVKDAVTHLFEQAISVYDEYVDPALERIKNGVSEVLEAILDAYNTYIAPMLLKWGEEFNKLYEQYLQPFIDHLLEVGGKFLEMISNLWQNVLAPLFSWLIDTIAPLVTAFLDMIWSTFVKVAETVIERLDSLMTILEGVIDFLTGVFSGDWEKAWQGICEVMQGIGELIYDLTIGALIKIVEWLGDVFSTAWQGAVEAIKNFFSPLAEWFSTNVIEPVKEKFEEWKNKIAAIVHLARQAVEEKWNNLCEWFSTNVIEPIRQKFEEWKNKVSAIVHLARQAVEEKWNNLCEWFNTNVIEPIRQKFEEWKNKVSAIVHLARQAVEEKWNNLCEWFTTKVIDPIKKKFEEWKTNITKLATDAWTGLKNAWNNACSWFTTTIIDPIKKGFTGAWDNIKQKGIDAFNGIKSGVRNAVNGIIDHINGLIRKLNGIGFDMPDVLGGGHVGFSIPTIPKLARGGIVDSPTIAQIGEAGKEMVVPLENTSFVDKLASSLGNAVMSAMNTSLNTSGGFGAENGQNVTLEMDGTTLARSMTPYIVKEMKRLGFNF